MYYLCVYKHFEVSLHSEEIKNSITICCSILYKNYLLGSSEFSPHELLSRQESHFDGVILQIKHCVRTNCCNSDKNIPSAKLIPANNNVDMHKQK